MSSFTISKIEYVKASAIMYAWEKSRRYPHQWFLDHVRENFCLCYVANNASVNEQYNVNDAFDMNKYDDVFKEYVSKTMAVMNGDTQEMTPKVLRSKMLLFFESIDYQIENEQYAEKVRSFLFSCICKLFADEIPEDAEWWGHIDFKI